MDVAAILILLVLLLAVFGSCFPQRSTSIALDPGGLARWEGGVRARYRGLTPLLQATGAFRWFRAPFFWVATGLLVVSLLVCTVKRWRRVWRRAFFRPVCRSQARFNAIAHTVALSLPAVPDLTGLVRESLERRGFSVRSKLDGDVLHMRGDRNRLAPLATLLSHLSVLLFLLGIALTAVHGRREDLTLAPHQTVDVHIESLWSDEMLSQPGGKSGLQVRNEGFTISHYADGSVAGYNLEVAFMEDGVDTMRGHIELNHPVIYRGIAFSLQGYAPTGEQHRVTLRAVRDPGYALVVVAGFLMFLALTVSLNFPDVCVHVRIEPGGTLRLAGQADHRAWGFGVQFGGLVRELDSWAE
jgi:cytochrome c biogenesis protein ResB